MNFKKNDLISIIIPVYNCEDYIERCITSLINQTYKNIEIIVIDDGSKDNTYEILNKISKCDKRIKIFHIENHGQGYARNYGMDIASGKWIGFCDADDYVNSQMYESLLKAAIDNNADMSCCDHSNIINGQIVYKRPNKNKKYVFVNKENALKGFASGELIAWGVWDKIFRKDKLLTTKFKNQKINAEDTLFLLEFIKNNNSFCYAGLGYYYHNDDNVSSFTKQKWGKSNLGLNVFYKELYKTICDYNINDCIDQVESRYFENLLSTFIRANRKKYIEAKDLLNDLKENYQKIMKSKNLKLLYKIDIAICLKIPKLGIIINFWYK